MSRSRLALLSFLVLLCLACGPRSLFTSVFPATYDVAVDLVFTPPDGVPRRSRNVTHCDVADVSDSYVPPRRAVEATGERNAWALTDGSAWVFAKIGPCRWFYRDRNERPRAPLPLVPRGTRPGRATDQVELWPTEAWWFDDATNPTRLEQIDATALLTGSPRGRVAGTVELVEEPPTATLSNVLPWVRDAHPDDTVFVGKGATLSELVDVTCTTVDPDATTWVPVRYPDPCAKVLSGCEEGATKGPCERPLGGLNPLFDPDGRTIRFSSDTWDPELLAALRRANTLPADAPRNVAGGWAPDLCIDDACFPATHQQPLIYVWPSRGRRVNVRSSRVDAADALTP